MTDNTQRLRVRMEFEYETEIFEGDPDDAFEIAKVEENFMLDNPAGALAVILREADDVTVKVSPVFVEEV